MDDYIFINGEPYVKTDEEQANRAAKSTKIVMDHSLGHKPETKDVYKVQDRHQRILSQRDPKKAKNAYIQNQNKDGIFYERPKHLKKSEMDDSILDYFKATEKQVAQSERAAEATKRVKGHSPERDTKKEYQHQNRVERVREEGNDPEGKKQSNMFTQGKVARSIRTDVKPYKIKKSSMDDSILSYFRAEDVDHRRADEDAGLHRLGTKEDRLESIKRQQYAAKKGSAAKRKLTHMANNESDDLRRAN